MAVRPILFSAPMVRALLDGRKTQTRRVLGRARVFGTPETKPYTLSGDDMIRALQNADGFQHLGEDGWFWEADAFEWQAPSTRTRWLAHIGYAPGDRLYVREAHYLTDNGHEEFAVFAADSKAVDDHLARVDALPADFPAKLRAKHRKLRPGIHLPRWASRLTLTVTDVRVERLNDCSEADALAEGVRPLPGDGPNRFTVDVEGWAISAPTAVETYRLLWNWINGAGAWEANPWVSVTRYTVEKRNIDQ